jgi:hypothetical protein
MKQTRSAIRSIIGAASAIAALGGCDAAQKAQPSSDPNAASAPMPAAGAPLTRESLTALINEPDDFARARKLGELLPTLGPESIPVVKDALDDAAMLEISAIEFELLLHYWSQHNRADAAWYALSGSPRAYRVAAIYGAVLPWVREDPEKALPTVRTFGIEAGDAGAATQNAIVRGWYESGHPGLEDYIKSLGAGFERQRALSAYANAMVRDKNKGPAGLVAWAEAIPESDADYKLDAFRRTALALVPHDLERAKQFCEAHCEGQHGSNLRVRIADRWSRDNPEAALDWLAASPKGSDALLSTRIAFANWGFKDRKNAIRWYQQQVAKHAGKEQPVWLEPAVMVYSILLGRENPIEGLASAEKVKDPQDRRVAIVQIAHEWYHDNDGKNKDAAEKWLAQSPLDEELRAIVRNPEFPAVPGMTPEQHAAAVEADRQKAAQK